MVLPNAAQISVGHMAHPLTEAVIKSMHLNRQVMLTGPTGAGKTYMIGSIAASMAVPFYKYSCSRDSSVHDLLGYKQPASETYLNTTFLKAYEGGGIFLVDEYDAMSGDMALFFNGVTDSSDFISVPHRDDNPIAKKHKDFYIVMCGNTWGNGSIEYSGRDFQDKALLDRFRLCRFYIDYNTKLEKTLVSNHQMVFKLRKGLEQVSSYLSTRNIEDIGKMMTNGDRFPDIVDMIISDLTTGEQKKVKQSLT